MKSNNFIKMVMAFALPVALQNLLSTTGSMIDTMMLGRLGENTVGAVGLCAQYSSLIFSGYWGFIGTGMMFFAQFWGEKNDRGINSSYGITIAFSSISAFVFTFLALVKPDWVMALYTGSKPIQEIGIQYLKVVGFAYPFQILAILMSSLLRSTERVKIPLAGAIVSLFVNFICNYILIFGKFGFPRMGAAGAAVGTVISSVSNVLVIVVCVLVKKIPYVLQIPQHWKWNRGLLREYLRKCFPILMNEVLIGVGNMMVNIVLGHQIEEAIAATAVFRTLEGLIIGFFSGFSSAATVLVGKEVGAGNHEEAFRRSWKIIYMCQLMTLALCLILILIHKPLLGLLGLSGLSYNYAFGMILIYTFFGIIRMGNWAHNDTFRSAGNSSYGSLLEIVFMFALVQPAIHIANDIFQAPFLVVFALCYIDDPVRYIMMQVRLYSKKWIRPVSEAGKATIEEFRKKNKIKMKS